MGKLKMKGVALSLGLFGAVTFVLRRLGAAAAAVPCDAAARNDAARLPLADTGRIRARLDRELRVRRVRGRGVHTDLQLGRAPAGSIVIAPATTATSGDRTPAWSRVTPGRPGQHTTRRTP